MSKITAKHPPLILRLLRLMDAFTKSDDERSFFLDNKEGFLIFIDLGKPAEDIDALLLELKTHPARYCAIPKLSFYEIKKIMEGFVNEKVYDIDTKEKLLDIIHSKDARENFLDFIYDHLTEQEKWQQYYLERFRIRIIEWLCQNNLHFVFEEDLDLGKSLLEKVKLHFLDNKVSKDLQVARESLEQKARSYYSLEALNPRPKRGRPPKQIIKITPEIQLSQDLFLTVPSPLRSFLYIPEIITSTAITFSSKYETEEDFLASRNQNKLLKDDWHSLDDKLSALRTLATKTELPKITTLNWDDKDEDEDEDEPLPKQKAKVVVKKSKK
ncbi:MAG: UPF0158 family protein [Chlamydiae bacterium]|nr:UPF0158 family protein [Chlamydiota bacterium]